MTETISIADYKKLKRKPKESQARKAFRHIMQSTTGITEEYKFHVKRKFRFDYAIVEHKIGIEYDGIIVGKSRHTTITGFSKDCEKFNLAATEGWLVLRYTALNYRQVTADIKKIIKNKKKNYICPDENHPDLTFERCIPGHWL